MKKPVLIDTKKHIAVDTVTGFKLVVPGTPV
jgi:hypothetical protein